MKGIKRMFIGEKQIIRRYRKSLKRNFMSIAIIILSSASGGLSENDSHLIDSTRITVDQV
jgi:hypothetical protein